MRLRRKANLLLCTLALTTAGCSSKLAYEEIQRNQTQACPTLPKDAYEQCMQSHNRSYEQYRREREELLDESAE